MASSSIHADTFNDCSQAVIIAGTWFTVSSRQYTGTCHDDEYLAGEHHGGGGSLDDVAPAELAEYEGGDESGVDTGNGSSLGRREHAAINAAENDDRGAQSPQAAAGGTQKSSTVERLASAEVAALRPPYDIEREHAGNHQARHDASGVEPRAIDSSAAAP